MADNPNAFKHALSPRTVQHLGGLIERVEPSFPRSKFVKMACGGLEDLELKARIHHIIEALKVHLPKDPKAAVATLVRVGEIWVREPGRSESMSFAAWPIIDFVGVYGLGDFEGSLQALRRLTPLFSAEFAVRPFITLDPARALKIMGAWRKDKDEHVRRLVSEGTRPRLPWGQRLGVFVKDPAPVLDLLEGLKDDPAEYVRRSVANNLNDIAKDHPEAVLKTCLRWKKGASPERSGIIKHATRSLVKAGSPAALELLGFDPKVKVRLQNLELSAASVAVGGHLGFSLELVGKPGQALVVDYAVHHVKKDGSRTAKVFKLRTLELPSSGRARLEKKHSFKPVTTRVYYSGPHAIEVLVNGRARAKAEFELVLGD